MFLLNPWYIIQNFKSLFELGFCVSLFIFIFKKINDNVKHFICTRSKAFVKVKFSIWAPIKFLYVCLRNIEQLILEVACEINCSVWEKNCFSQQPIPEMRCQINYFQLHAGSLSPLITSCHIPLKWKDGGA